MSEPITYLQKENREFLQREIQTIDNILQTNSALGAIALFDEYRTKSVEEKECFVLALIGKILEIYRRNERQDDRARRIHGS